MPAYNRILRVLEGDHAFRPSDIRTVRTDIAWVRVHKLVRAVQFGRVVGFALDSQGRHDGRGESASSLRSHHHRFHGLEPPLCIHIDRQDIWWAVASVRQIHTPSEGKPGKIGLRICHILLDRSNIRSKFHTCIARSLQGLPPFGQKFLNSHAHLRRCLILNLLASRPRVAEGRENQLVLEPFEEPK